MATLEANREYWNDRYNWDRAGLEWSRPWGGPEAQWHCTVLPRIRRSVPASTILEIGCGFGRWTFFLKDLCQRLVAVDISERCVSACRERFASYPSVECRVNDGLTLAGIADRSIDFAFSFDSLVHADPAVLEGYLYELARTLRPGGTAFLHHSNLGEYQQLYETLQRHAGIRRVLVRLGIVDAFCHLRDPLVSATLVRQIAARSGLQCLTQELVQWRSSRAMLDCMSTFANLPPTGKTRVDRNLEFAAEVRNAMRLSTLYGLRNADS